MDCREKVVAAEVADCIAWPSENRAQNVGKEHDHPVSVSESIAVVEGFEVVEVEVCERGPPPRFRKTLGDGCRNPEIVW